MLFHEEEVWEHGVLIGVWAAKELVLMQVLGFSRIFRMKVILISINLQEYINCLFHLYAYAYNG